MSEIDLDKLLQDVKIPPAPEILVDLNYALQKDEPDLSAIARIIQKDTGISGLVIKTVNSPLFGLRNTVTSIPQAIYLLGIGYTVNIVMGLVLRQAFDNRGENLPRYWESPSNIALIAASLASRLLACSSDEAYLLGLFHNSGHALIQQRHNDYSVFYPDYINHPDHTVTYFENEKYQFDHAIVGYYLATNWGVPQNLRDIILNHHNVLEFLDQGSLSGEKNCMKAMMAVLKIAEHVDLLYDGTEEDFEWLRVKDVVLGYLGLSEVDYEEIQADMLEKLHTELD